MTQKKKKEKKAQTGKKAKAPKIMRPEAHEVDTAARREVPRVLPTAWEHRETTGGDYGIDMLIELFRSGQPLGSYLLLQIKGTTAKIDENVQSLAFDMPVNTLKYSQLFVAPVVLVFCPVNASEPHFFYLWLQEYIRVVLDHDNPKWRDNKKTVRVHIPTENRMPDRTSTLAFISNYPRRLSDWVQFARIQDDMRCVLNELPSSGEPRESHLRRLREKYEELLSLAGIFCDDTWPWGTSMRKRLVETSIRSIDILIRGAPYSAQDLKDGMGMPDAVDYFERDGDRIHFMLWSNLIHQADRLMAALSTANDHRHNRILWEQEGSHDF